MLQSENLREIFTEINENNKNLKHLQIILKNNNITDDCLLNFNEEFGSNLEKLYLDFDDNPNFNDK